MVMPEQMAGRAVAGIAMESFLESAAGWEDLADLAHRRGDEATADEYRAAARRSRLRAARYSAHLVGYVDAVKRPAVADRVEDASWAERLAG
jgi:hypothetical protein